MVAGPNSCYFGGCTGAVRLVFYYFVVLTSFYCLCPALGGGSVVLRLTFMLATVVVKTHLNNVKLKMVKNIKLTVLAFMFNLRPATPPVSIVLVVTTIVSTTSYVRTTKKLSCVMGLTRGLLHGGPSRIAVLDPVIACLFAFITKAKRMTCSILPIVTRITARAGVHPREPLNVTIVTSRRTVATDPVSTTAITLLKLLTKFSVALFSVLGVAVPTAVVNMLMNTFFSVHMNGRLVSSPRCRGHITRKVVGRRGIGVGSIRGGHRTLISMLVFVLTAIFVMFFNSFRKVHPSFLVSKRVIALNVSSVVRVIVLSTTTLVLLFAGASNLGTARNSIFPTKVRTMVTVFKVT